MIEVITGKPGSGKTYLAVQRMMELPLGKYVIWHNIDGLNAEAFPEPSVVRSIPSDLRSWCQKSNQIEWAEACREKYGRPMLVVIDEAQMTFADKNDGLKGWLSWHRHLGQDIWLICQHSRMLHQDYFNLAEYEIRAVKSLVLNMLVYQYRMGGETFKTIRRRRDRKVFAAYRSFDQTEASKPSFKLVYWGVGLIVLCVGGFFLLQKSFADNAKVYEDKKPPGQTKGSGSRDRAYHQSAAVDKPVDLWETISYSGVVGNRVLVQKLDSGFLTDLGEAVREKYALVEASGRSCVVVTANGRRTVRKLPLLVGKDEALESGGTAPRSKRKRENANGSVSGNGNHGS